MVGLLFGIALWLFAIFANYLQWDLTGIWWQNATLYASLQTIGTAIIIRKLPIGGRK